MAIIIPEIDSNAQHIWEGKTDCRVDRKVREAESGLAGS
jgi:hypothetical protein